VLVAVVAVTVGEVGGGRCALGSGALDENLRVSPQTARRRASPRQRSGRRSILRLGRDCHPAACRGKRVFGRWRRRGVPAAVPRSRPCRTRPVLRDRARRHMPWWQWVSGRPWALSLGPS